MKQCSKRNQATFDSAYQNLLPRYASVLSVSKMCKHDQRLEKYGPSSIQWWFGCQRAASALYSFWYAVTRKMAEKDPF